MQADEPFSQPNPRKRRKGKGQRVVLSPLDLFRRAQEILATDGTWLSDCRKLLKMAFYNSRIHPQKVLCLGLGSPSSSRDARAQLVLLSQLCVSSQICSTDVSLYDPVFTDADQDLFRLLGMVGVSNEKDVPHTSDDPAILYMPHCDLTLYETVLRANWTRGRLSDIVFVANRLGDYIDHNPVSKLERESPCLSNIAPLIESYPLPMSEAFPTAFNNMAVQYLKRPSHTNMRLTDVQQSTGAGCVDLHCSITSSPNLCTTQEPWKLNKGKRGNVHVNQHGGSST